MNKKSRAIALTAGVIAGVLVLAGCAAQDGVTPGMGGGPGGMMTQTSEPGADFSAADQMFLVMMIPHHEQAIEMADILLAKSGIPAEVTELAQKIKDAQGPEIETMRSWLEEWNVDYDKDSMGGMGHGDGMMSDGDMTALEDASGAKAARLFLEQMIVHHEGAIDMGEMALRGAQNPDVIALIDKIIADQTAEIATMRDLLEAL
ncbi:DUF305 domain-containing protein [uncultured Microbacterium sp.]|uniref:DUF305 domain-containing protein n=1 Tax=uncultured Microbacterium sp. TaxID=191216 RepID=A0A1Y5NZ99_9MICO|nr:DUF305 domain-containing protein [uncultured Microbacterium sp.]SBS71797.1 conserved exported hypothetical protein [uncultured Microbacterium sp.]